MTEVAPARAAGPTEGTVRAYVGRQISRLLAHPDSPGTRAALARLRSAVGREPGEVPEIWDLTIDSAPGRPLGDAPTREERAIHAAMTLFALHQQSRPQPMHVPGIGLGQAVRRLEDRAYGPRAEGDTSPVRRRFDALASASSLAEAVQHLRGLVSRLRSQGEGIPLDYAALAADLEEIQRPGRAKSVRLRWARQYYRTDRAPEGEHTKTQVGADVAGAEHSEESTR